MRSAGRGVPAREGQVGEGRGVGNSIGLVKDPAGIPEFSWTVSRDVRKIVQAELWSLTPISFFHIRYYNWTTAAPLLLAMQAFQKPLPKVSFNMRPKGWH